MNTNVAYIVRAMPATTSERTSQGYFRDANQPRRLTSALEDLSGGVSRWRLAWALARLDIRNRYRGSVLGPFWMTASTAIMIAGIGILYSTLFQMSLREYLPWIAVSLLLWNTISQVVTDACQSLIGAEGMIRQIQLPYTVHVLRFVIRNAITAAHSLPLIALILLGTGALPGAEVIWIMPGILLLFINACAAGLFLGMFCARFRDVPQVVTNVMQLAFFLSPVLWKPSLLGEYTVWLVLNPFYSIMETMRGPLIEGGVSTSIWISALFYTVAMCIGSFLFFVRFRSRIAFWV